MKKLLLVLMVVIVLISINWFRVLSAQDLSSLSESQKKELLRKYQSSSPAKVTESLPKAYQTPDIYGEDQGNTRSEGQNDAKSQNTPDSSGSRILSSITQLNPDPNADSLPKFSQLRPFGYELFALSDQTELITDIATASDYVLGPSDELLIYLWGRVEKEYHVTVDREGKVFLPKVGSVVAWGLTVDQFTKQAQKQLGKVYSEFDLSVSLGKIRSIRIYVTGEVKRPGCYTISSLTSMFNAMYHAGGPNERGTMRNIRLVREGREIGSADLYQLLLHGDNSSDVRLQTGDVIHVPVAGRRVAIRGEINRSAIYEIGDSASALDLLKLSGNSTATAHLDRVMLERVSEFGEWEVLDLNLNPLTEGYSEGPLLRDGDRLTVSSIFDARTNMVAVFGQVKHPGYYERTDTTRISHLISRCALQPYDVYYERADLFRFYPDRRCEVISVDLRDILSGSTANDLLVSNRDSIHIYAIDEIVRDRYVHIEGEVAKPGRYPLYDEMSAADLIFLAGSFNPTADRYRAELARIDSVGEVSLTYVSLVGDDDKSLLLRPDDHLYVRRIPLWTDDRTVTIDGEVMFPGNYMLSNRDETLQHLIDRAGGFSERAFPKGIVFKRHSIGRNLEKQNINQVLDHFRPITQDSLGNPIEESFFNVDTRSMNRIIIDYERNGGNQKDKYDIVLRPQDKIYVPPIPSGISVMGAVGANGTTNFIEGRKVKYYIKRAGNFCSQADKKGTLLIRAGGEVISKNGTLNKRVELGDIIIVPTKIEKEGHLLKTITTAVTAATGILTSVYIVSRM